jgi:DNA-binding XRE family transcriptional regulator
MKRTKSTKITDAAEILHRRYVGKDARKLAELEQIRADNAVARKIYDLRTKAGLSQRALAKLIGTSSAAISRIEDADYEGHSLATLNKIAEALNKRVEIRFVPVRQASGKLVHA